MRLSQCLGLLTFALFITTVQSAVTGSETERPEPVAPGKFIPTFAVKYGGTPGWPPVEEAARFDLLDVSGPSRSGATTASTGSTNSIQSTSTWAERGASLVGWKVRVVMSTCASSTMAGSL